MTQPLPPLLCNTPPPIDFDDGNDNDDFGDFERATAEYEANDHSLDIPSLPVDADYSIELDDNLSEITFLEDRKPIIDHVENSKHNTDKHSEKDLEKDFVLSDDTSSQTNVLPLTTKELDENTLADVLENRLGLEKNDGDSDSQYSVLYANNLDDDEDINDLQVTNNVEFGHNTDLPSVQCGSVNSFNSLTPPHDKTLIESSSENEEKNKTVMLSASQLSTEFKTREENQNEKFENSHKLRIGSSETEEIISNVCVEQNLPVANPIGPAVDTEDSKEFEQIVINDSDFNNEFPVHQTDDPFNVNESSSPVDFQFGADFSQFEADFCENLTNKKISENNSNDHETKLSSSQTEDDDDFEDFQDFNTARNEEVLNFEGTNDVANQTPSISILALTNFDSKIISILKEMFPCSEENEINLDTRNIKESHINCSGELISKLGRSEPATALDYQWSHSKIKQSLIKALGIDSRNILYGEKWKNSVPRFAANLLPSEPLQPLKILGSAHISKSGNSKSKTTQDSVKYENVPEVEFDWNNSGLVNPLDASHVYTLLDLNQLVMVTNLDKIKLDSSSSPCSSVPVDKCLTSTDSLATFKTNVPINIQNHRMENSIVYVENPDANCAFDDGFDTHKNTYTNNIQTSYGIHSFGNGFNNNHKKCSFAAAANNVNIMISNATAYNINSRHGRDTKLHNTFFDQYLELRVKEILCEGKSEEIHSTQFCNSNECHNQQTSDKKNNSPKTNSIDELTSDVHNDLVENEFVEQTQNSEADFYYKDENFSYDMAANSPYVYPLKETHIYTPSKVNTELEDCKMVDDKSSFDFEYTVAAAGIIIDEKVVKKEYRDIEYDPKKLMIADISNKIENVSTENHNNVNTLKLSKFNTNNFIENRKDILSESYSIREEQQSKSANPFASISKSDNITNRLDSTKDVFQSSALQDESEINAISENFQGALQNNSQLSDNNEPAVDDDFTEFQFVPPPFNESLKSHQFFQSVEEEKSNLSKTLTPTIMDEMILSPAVLLPQSIKFDSNPKIEWPQPGINSEELARIEQLFPLTSEKDTITKHPLPSAFSSKDDDDWSEFVSVPASSNLPETQRIPETKNFTTSIAVKPADDEWSDFICSTPNAWTSFRETPQCSTWNQPLQNTFNIFASEQSSKFIDKSVPTKMCPGINFNNNTGQHMLQSIPDHQQNHFVPPQQIQVKQVNSNLNPNAKRQSNGMPNISMVPDLRFVASRSFINAPKSTTSKK